MPLPTFPSGLKDVVIPRGTELIRIHHKDKRPVWFGPKRGLGPSYRFDAPGGEYRTLYAARDLEGAFVETVLRKSSGRLIGRGFVEERAWSALRATRDLKLAKLFHEGLQWHGVDANISSSDDYAHPRQVALAFHSQFPDLDGIAYMSRHDNERLCYVLFNRVTARQLKVVSTTLFKDVAARVNEIMAHYGAHFDPGAFIPPP